MISFNYDKKRVIYLNNKTRNIIISLYVVALIALIVGTTFSYFTVINVASTTPKVETKTATLNYILFDTGNAISLTPDDSNFRKGMGNVSADTYARVYLKHAEGDTAASVKYNIFISIEKNTLEYSNEDAELILEVTDPNGNVVTSIENLNYTSVVDGDGNTIKGFDITTAKGDYYITSNREISTESELTETWNAKVTYVNLNTIQDKNYDKELKGIIKIEKAEN